MLNTLTTKYHSTGEVGDLLHVQAWRIARLFELGLIDDPSRIGGRRIIPDSLIPTIKAALIAKGWLPTKTEVGTE